MFNCARCGEVVTCPYFYKGDVYGYTCIEIVSGNKRRKHSLRFKALDTIKIEIFPSTRYVGQDRVKVVFHPAGFVNKKSVVWLELDKATGMYYFGGYMLINNILYQTL